MTTLETLISAVADLTSATNDVLNKLNQPVPVPAATDEQLQAVIAAVQAETAKLKAALAPVAPAPAPVTTPVTPVA